MSAHRPAKAPLLDVMRDGRVVGRVEPPRAIGFGALFAVGLARALAETPPLDALIGDAVLKSPAPPGLCPCCGFAALGPERDPNGDWTWNCVGGCNP